MAFVLSSDNVLDYLVHQKLCKSDDLLDARITVKECKNFNLLVNLHNKRSLLIKQERNIDTGSNQSDLWPEWRINEFVSYFPELRKLRALVSESIHFDPEHSILVLNYLENYIDCSDFYSDHQNQFFPTTIAASLGTTLATIHKSTLDCQHYKDFLTQHSADDKSYKVKTPKFLRGLERVGPGLFSRISTDGIEFWKLYQRYSSLHEAMVNISQTFDPCCLTHNDLALWNILINRNWDMSLPTLETSDPAVKLIDWEFFSWGDPAYDLGMLLSGYLRIWLHSLVVSNAVDIQIALRLATTPLEKLQPSMVAIFKSYLTHFPEILARHPNFLSRVMQFAGLVMIKKIQGRLEQLNAFDNTSICTLQVAKTLLCSPEQSIFNVLGTTDVELITSQSVSASVR